MRRLQNHRFDALAVALLGAGATASHASHPSVVIDVPSADRADLAVPALDLWRTFAHADVTSESFPHWDEEGEVPVACARCHFTEGVLDYLGADGTAPGSVKAP